MHRTSRGVRTLQGEGVGGTTRAGPGAAKVQSGNCTALGTEASPGRKATSPSTRALLYPQPDTLGAPGLASSGNTCPAEATDGK